MNFFRKIRRYLVAQHKPARYLKYAIGEIILVVIGILIALQINNWNEFRKERKKEEMYLKSLKSDLRESQAELKRVIEKTERVTSASIQLLSFSTDTVPMPPPAVFDSLVAQTFGYTIAMTNEGTINDISGSGDLKVIRNDSLRRMIASWDAGFKMIRERENLLKEAFQRNKNLIEEELYMGDILSERIGFADDGKRRFIVTDVSHRNRILNLIISSSPLNELYLEKIKSLDTMIAITESELNKLSN
ncbi:DUF6090 family protein [Salinimicrobium xinjiangense]|uniref:DUF6090 family protein n=1 Tax=Salinimicrobium xinjiangense TaxID=438596 RepID=UPI00048C24EA|nr:DUF6090 family protein [Salinimicrobium xinjiangense]